MPLHETDKFLYGIDARRPRAYALGIALNYIAEKLNDPDGPYYEGLELSIERRVIATDSPEVAGALYNEEGSDAPIVYGRVGRSSSKLTSRNIQNVPYEGKRHEMSLRFDMGVNDVTSGENDAPETKISADRTLFDFFIDVFEDGLDELAALGLHNLDVMPDEEMQRAGIGRNPVLLTCHVVTIKGYGS